MPLKSLDYLFVVIQFTLFGAFIFEEGPRIDFTQVWQVYLCFCMIGTGAIICSIAVLQLNSNLPPFPTPRTGSSLITNGVYSHIRHPIYSGILLGLLGLSLYYQSLYKIGVVILLLVLFYFKTSYEEQRLARVFKEYANYKAKTKRFVPFVF